MYTLSLGHGKDALAALVLVELQRQRRRRGGFAADRHRAALGLDLHRRQIDRDDFALERAGGLEPQRTGELGAAVAAAAHQQHLVAQAATFAVFSPAEAAGVSFSAAGSLLLDVDKYDLEFT